jgi:hypothetical protein
MIFQLAYPMKPEAGFDPVRAREFVAREFEPPAARRILIRRGARGKAKSWCVDVSLNCAGPAHRGLSKKRRDTRAS